jgi:hypothetical protein
MKKKKGGNQKLRPRRSRRTIETGRRRDVQCRPPHLEPEILEPQIPRQGKYEEKKRRKVSKILDGGEKYLCLCEGGVLCAPISSDFCRVNFTTVTSMGCTVQNTVSAL